MVLVFLSSQTCFCRRSCSRCRKKSSSGVLCHGWENRFEDVAPRASQVHQRAFRWRGLVDQARVKCSPCKPTTENHKSLNKIYFGREVFGSMAWACPLAFFMSDKSSDGGSGQFLGQTDEQGGRCMLFIRIAFFFQRRKTYKIQICSFNWYILTQSKVMEEIGVRGKLERREVRRTAHDKCMQTINSVKEWYWEGWQLFTHAY